MVTVVPMTSGSRPAAFRLATDFRGIAGLLLGDQLRSVLKIRLMKRLGVLDPETVVHVLRMLREMFEE